MTPAEKLREHIIKHASNEFNKHDLESCLVPYRKTEANYQYRLRLMHEGSFRLDLNKLKMFHIMFRHYSDCEVLEIIQ